MFKKTSNWFWEQKPQCWFWSIEESNQDYFIEQLKHHNKLGSEHHKAMLSSLKKDDLIVIKNTPDSEHFILVKVIKEGDFKSENNNLANYLPIEILGEFYKYSSIVPASLLHALHQQHNLINMANSKQRNIIASLSSQMLESYEPVNVIIELWQRTEEYLGRAGAIIIFLFTIVEIMSAVEGTVVDYAEFKSIVSRWYWALR
ncbi:MAG: hypothetical protein KAG43_06730 [Candidatus Marithrix sp.]|nr:hypothetical protein [Candidatus Marithrix sp.]